MSITDKEWILVADELDDAQSVLSVSRSDGEPPHGEFDETVNSSQLFDPLRLNSVVPVRQSTATYGWSPDLVTQSASQLIQWIASCLKAGGTQDDVDMSLLRTVNLSTSRILDHKECIMPNLGKIASSQLRACGFIGSLYVPNVALLSDAEKLLQRANWTQYLKC